MIYKWKNGAGPTGIDAQAAGEELERIRVHNNGRLEPRFVVEASRPREAPLHNAFEWNDKKAADAWRQNQASYMIRHVDVVVEEGDKPPTPIRAFVSVKRDEDRSYTSIQHALSEDELRQQLVAQAWSDLEAWRKRYAELVEFAKVFALIEARAA